MSDEARARELCRYGGTIFGIGEITETQRSTRINVIAAALRTARAEGLEVGAKIAENNFPYAATEGERLALHQCLRIAEKCRARAAQVREGTNEV